MFKIKKMLMHQKVLVLIQLFAKFFAKLPHLPNKIVEIITKIMPWPTIILGILSLVATLISLLFSTIALIALDWPFFWQNILITIMTGFTSTLLIKAFKPLKKINAEGWIYLFWVHLINVCFTVFEGFAGRINPLLAVINILIFSYLLFEIGPQYTYLQQSDK